MAVTAVPHRIAPNYTGPRFFGAPVGDFSFFQTLLIAVASGALAFFVSTFLAIMTMLVLTGMGRHPDFSIAYKWVGAPVGGTVLVAAVFYLGSLLAMRLKNKGNTR